MKPPSDSRARLRPWAAVAIAVALTGGAVGAARRYAAAASEGADAARVDAPAPPSDPALAKFQHRVLNFLLLPLLDDAEPPRWTLRHLAWICDGRGEPSLGGQPIVEGAPVPAAPFVLRWRLDGCAAMSDSSLIVEGVIDLAVFRNGDKLDAKVVGRSLRTVTETGERRWSGRFAGVAPVTVSAPDGR